MTDALALWQRYCQTRLIDRTIGCALDFSRVRFQEAQLAPLWPKFTAAIAAMSQLEAGSIANPDEGRMVGHYWLRAPELAPTPAIAEEIRATQVAILQFAAKVRSGVIHGASGPYKHVLHVGIGGSALGPQFVAQALGTAADPLTVHFVDNTDPDGIERTLSEVYEDLGRTLVVVVSKSGGTPETRNGMLEIQAAFRHAGLAFGPQAVAITQAGSQLDKVALAEGWLQRFPMWDWVGGRTSVLSAVGLVPAALQGLPVNELLHGAAAMDRWTRNADPRQNPAVMLATAWHVLGSGKGLKDMVILPYKDRLALFSKYLQQLVMESLGKQLDRQGHVVEQGLAVYGNKGSTDQHAYVQQLRDGLPNFFATFIQVLRDQSGPAIEVEPGITSGDYLQGFLLGTRTALYEQQRDSITITIDEVTGVTVGALIALYERAVGLYAEVIDINAYHQPGVEAGKKAAAAILALQAPAVAAVQAAKSPLTAMEVAAAMGRPEAVETISQILEHLAANRNRGVIRTSGDGPLTDRYIAG